MTAVDPTEQVRRRELVEQHGRGELVERNETFVQYATGTAFQITLSQNQIRGLAQIDSAVARDDEWHRNPVSESVMHALIRRGLVHLLITTRELNRFRGDDGPLTFQKVIRVTRAGQLMLDLLAEAGLVLPRALRHPLPPPPPGWLDPRPKVQWTHPDPGGLPTIELRPSDREAAGGVR